MKQNRIIYLLSALVMATLFVACDNQTSNSVVWGETEFYTDFLWKKYEPVKMTRTVEFEFNEDALHFGVADVRFDLMEKNAENKMERAQHVQLYKNGVECANNILVISPKDKEVEVSVEFLADAAEGNHSYYLKWIEDGNLDRVEYLDLAEGFFARKKDIHNSLAKCMLIGAIVILIILLVIWIIGHMTHPSLRFSKVYIDHGDGAGEVSYSTGGYKLILTNKPYPVGFFHRFFCGNVVVIRNDFWTDRVTITSKRAQGLRVVGLSDIYMDTDEPMRKTPITFTNGNRRATLTTK